MENVEIYTALESAEEALLNFLNTSPNQSNLKTGLAALGQVQDVLEVLKSAQAGIKDAWMPIETAPKDGQVIWIARDDGSVEECHCDIMDWKPYSGKEYPFKKATHWQPYHKPSAPI